MKKIILIGLLVSMNAFSYDCDYFKSDSGKTKALTLVVNEFYDHGSFENFCSDETILDLEVLFIPNYFKFQEEEDDHYRVIVHKSYSSCTFIYNSTREFITENSCYSTW